MFSADLKEKAPTLSSFLQAARSKNRLSHAYLLCGNNEVLKEQISFELSKILNCSSPLTSGEPCNQCQNCNWLNQKTHPEVPIVLEPDLEKSKRGIILVAQIGDLLKKLVNKSRFQRVVIIKKAESQFLPQECANSLLKTIEEPSNNLLFLLFARDVESVLPTIVSRCQVLNVPSQASTQNLINAELAQNLFAQNLSWHSSANLAEKFLTDFENKPSEALDELLAYCLQELEKNNKNDYWLSKIELIEKTQTRLKAFCSAKPAMEELFWKLSQ